MAETTTEAVETDAETPDSYTSESSAESFTSATPREIVTMYRAGNA